MEWRSFLFYVVPSRSRFRSVRWPGDIEGEGATGTRGENVNVSISRDNEFAMECTVARSRFDRVIDTVADDDSCIRHGYGSMNRTRFALLCRLCRNGWN